MSENRPPIALPFAIVIALLSVSTASIFIRFAQREAPSLVIAALRLTFASLILAPIALTRYRDELSKLTRTEMFLGLLSGIFLAIHFATWISSLEYTSVASSVVFVSTGPLWVALLSPIFLKESPTKYVLIGMLLALLGGTIIGIGDSCINALPVQVTQESVSVAGNIFKGWSCPPLPDLMQGSAFFGNFLALVGAWTVAGYLMIGRRLRTGMSLIPYIFIVYGNAAIVLIIIMFAAGLGPTGYPPMLYIWVLLMALIPQLIGHSTYNWILRYLPAALVSIITLGEPIGSAILAYFILSEAPTLLTIFGGVLILAGIYVSSKN